MACAQTHHKRESGTARIRAYDEIKARQKNGDGYAVDCRSKQSPALVAPTPSYFDEINTLIDVHVECNDKKRGGLNRC